jgi:hypothetical protein
MDLAQIFNKGILNTNFHQTIVTIPNHINIDIQTHQLLLFSFSHSFNVSKNILQ